MGGTIEETYKISEAKTPEAKLKLAKELPEAAKKTDQAGRAVRAPAQGGGAGLRRRRRRR